MLTAILAEKPSVARDIAHVLGPSHKGNGYLTVGSEWIITWALGHLVTLAAPEAYHPAWKRWSWDTLPLLPDPFQWRPVAGRTDQLAIVQRILTSPKVTRVIGATDADREGEGILRAVLRYVGCAHPVDRLWLSENTPSAIRTALAALRPLRDFDGLGAAAEARGQADWVVGLNATRAYTLRFGGRGQGALSVGRVQTPTLRLIVDRDQAIAAFQAEPYWQVVVTFDAPAGSYIGRWTRQTDDATVDRIPTAADAAAIADRVPPGTTGVLEAMTQENLSINPPLLFNLNELQKAANRQLGLTAQQTLDACQKLYDGALVSYPRTDAHAITAAIAATIPDRLRGVAWTGSPYRAVAGQAFRADRARRLIDEAQVAAAGHYAIIPTGHRPPPHLGDREQQVYDLIVRRFLAALLPPGKDARTTIWTRAGGERFRTQGTTVVDPGWRVAVRPAPTPPEAGSRRRTRAADDPETDPPIPDGLATGDAVTVTATEVPKKSTKAPPRLTDARLLTLMEKHALGTPATRARIVELLLQRGFVRREKKTLVSTEKGQALLAVVPDRLQSPELTGEWERRLEAIAAGAEAMDPFLADIRTFTSAVVDEVRQQGPTTAAIGDAGWGRCPICHTGIVIQGKKGWGCSRWREGCSFTIWLEMSGKTLTTPQVKTLLAGKVTREIRGFQSKAGNAFAARLQLDAATGRVRFVFADRAAPPRTGRSHSPAAAP